MTANEMTLGTRDLYELADIQAFNYFVPGSWVCPQCAKTHSAPVEAIYQACPHDGSPMERQTWKHYAVCLERTAEDRLRRAVAAESVEKAARGYLVATRLVEQSIAENETGDPDHDALQDAAMAQVDLEEALKALDATRRAS